LKNYHSSGPHQNSRKKELIRSKEEDVESRDGQDCLAIIVSEITGKTMPSSEEVWSVFGHGKHSGAHEGPSLVTAEAEFLHEDGGSGRNG
jgi:hypothetical protein